METGPIDDFTDLARELVAAPDENAQLELAVEAALELVEGCDHAGAATVDAGVLCSRAGSDQAVAELDRLQQEVEEGPVMQAVCADELVLSSNLAVETRWPKWSPMAHEKVGVSTVMSLLLYADDKSFGAISLYADKPHAFDRDDLAVASALAGHVAVAMAAGRKIQHLGIALGSRTIIGQAEGILMERLGIDGDQAFAYLRRTSQVRNVKLVRLAAEIVETRKIPG